MHYAALLNRIRPIELAELFKKVLRVTRDDYTNGGRTWYIDPASHFGNSMMSQGTYEPHVTTALLSLLKPGDVFFDVGANEGWYSVRAAEIVGEHGKVVSIEPQTRLWPILLRNFLLNGLHNYILVPYAVGPVETLMDMVVYPSMNTGASGLVIGARNRHMRREKAGVIPLRRIAEVHDIRKIRLAKVDVEGYELEVLESARGLLGERIENIYVEMHPKQLRALGQSPVDVEHILESNGYRKRRVCGVEIWTVFN